MLCPFADELPRLDGKLTVVHITRHPNDWAESILRFRASGLYRHVIDFIPYATPLPYPRPDGWRSFSSAEKVLWRWRYCNEMIESLQAHGDYFHLRFEELLGVCPGARVDAMEQLLQCLNLGVANGNSLREVAQAMTQGQRENLAPQKRENNPPSLSPQSLQSICGELMNRYGYHEPVPDT